MDHDRGLEVRWYGSVAVVILDRPEVLNALDSPLRIRLARELMSLAQDPGLAALVLTGAGERAFCVGQDLREAEHLDDTTGRRWMETWVGLYEAILRVPVPTVALINGAAAGAGLQLGLLCDLRLASSSARLGLREIDVGLPAVTGFWLFSAILGRSRAIELVLTGRLMDAAEALESGMLHGIVDPSLLRKEGLTLAERLAAMPPGAMRATRAWLVEQTLPALHEASAAASRDQVAALESGEPQFLMTRFLARARERRASTGGIGSAAGGEDPCLSSCSSTARAMLPS